MRVSILVTMTACLATLSTVSAAPPEFPYEAVVQRDGVIVRGGPGERYDPTLKLPSGQRVTVHRHNPGGWFTISPPPGSFSWIDASYVETTGDGRGIVKALAQGGGLPPRVVVWIGSQFTNEHRITGRQLASGDEVTVIGEKTQQTERGPTKFYKIAPPRHEYRWIKGNYVMPLSEVDNIAQLHPSPSSPFDTSAVSNDPFAGPSFASDNAATSPGFPIEQTPTLLERELDRAIDRNAAVKSGTPSEQLEQERRHLYELDERLRNMLSLGVGSWRLEEMEQSYRALQASASPGVAGIIDTRLEMLNARKAIQAEYDAFVAITSETDRRDAELSSLQNSNITGTQIGTSAVELGFPQPANAQQDPPRGTSPSPVAGGPIPVPGTDGGTAAPASPSSGVDPDQLDGAGIVARMPIPRPGVPPHILVAPDGRLLAYLQADRGINLDAHLGQSVGVIGRRFQEARLRSDLIIVQRLTPIRLLP